MNELMKTLILYLMIAFGVAGVLYCRVNLSMSWDDMSAAIESILPRVLVMGVVVAGMAVTFYSIARPGRSE